MIRDDIDNELTSARARIAKLEKEAADLIVNLNSKWNTELGQPPSSQNVGAGRYATDQKGLVYLQANSASFGGEHVPLFFSAPVGGLVLVVHATLKLDHHDALWVDFGGSNNLPASQLGQIVSTAGTRIMAWLQRTKYLPANGAVVVSG